MVPHVFEYSGVSKPKFLIPIEHQVNQQCRSTNDIVVVSFAATTSKRQFPEHILLPEHFRKLCRSIVGPPSEVDWKAAWNEIRHLWNGRVKSFAANARVNTRFYITCTNYWNLAKHVASLTFALLASVWYSTCGLSTKHLGVKIDAECRYANLRY